MFEIRSYRETDSTNDDATPLLGVPEHLGAVLSADYQRAGRGRRQRSWVAPPDSSLLVTTILPRPVRADALWAVPFWTALGVADGIERATGLRVSLQWPNDILLDGRKCCGILCISRVVGDIAWVGCGTGINVIRPANDASLAEVVPPPAFLSDGARDVARERVLEHILAAYEALLGELDRPESIARAWEHRAELAGTPYRILLDGAPEPFDARVRRIGSDGSLVVMHDGKERSVSLADARVIREAS